MINTNVFFDFTDFQVQQIKAEYDSTTSKDTYSTALHYNTKEQQTLQNQFTVDLMEMKRRNDEWLARTQELTTVRADMPHWWWYEGEVQEEEARYSSASASGSGGLPVNFERKTPSLSNGNVTVDEEDRTNHTTVVLATAMKSAGIGKGLFDIHNKTNVTVVQEKARVAAAAVATQPPPPIVGYKYLWQTLSFQYSSSDNSSSNSSSSNSSSSVAHNTTHHQNHTNHTQPHAPSLQAMTASIVREIGICCTCWWYSLCDFQYRQHYDHTCSYHFDC